MHEEQARDEVIPIDPILQEEEELEEVLAVGQIARVRESEKLGSQS